MNKYILFFYNKYNYYLFLMSENLALSGFNENDSSYLDEENKQIQLN